jgi:triosephosphate isomerase
LTWVVEAMKKKLIAGNWKMNGSLAANEALVRAVIAGMGYAGLCDVAVCVPAPYLAQVRAARRGRISLGAQDVSAA